jgi:putative transcriptional regulator
MKPANRLKIVLAEKGKTNKWLAETIKKDQTTVSKWCTNKAQPSVEVLYVIADALEADVKELLVSNRTERA